ncbi:hypothetical protein ACFFUP_12205 [Vibrio ostreicida]|uniref:Uncharacterized protein n=1 Tax=Vibrio ostreicida TaxID=526588 RepID=A0ABT8BZL1_9VIBR|nr:hypothetical protein [Vibrio ostreicida]MDN3611265.1 hypothetical protein [Vibrio ostreicida]MDN3612596.1 hypothetical protein [Vibrio ostreicida]NPD09213.1 hypothetical protein [Vibrio ostreicida]
MKKPTVPLPELTPEYQQRARQEVEDAKVLYQFTLIKEPFFDYGAAIPTWIGAGLLFWFASLGGWIEMSIVIVLVGFSGWYLFYTMNPKVEQVVTLTEKGIIVSQLEMVPEMCYTVVRYSAYFTIGVSLVALLVIGPMAFAGAGAGALMAFKMTGVVKRPKVEIQPLVEGIVYKEEKGRVQFKHGLHCCYLYIDLEPYGLDDETFNKVQELHDVCYHADSDTQRQFIKAVHQVIKTREVEPLWLTARNQKRKQKGQDSESA